MWLITTLLYIYRLCLRLSRLLVAVNSALRMDLTFRQDLSVDLWVLVVGFLQTFSEVSGKMISLIMLGLLRAQYIYPDLLSKKKLWIAYIDLWAQDIWKASLPPLKGLIFQDMYWENGCETVEANRSYLMFHLSDTIFWKFLTFISIN